MKIRKKIYFGAITMVLLIMACLSFVIKQDKPTYHKITNPELIKLIAEYIDKGKGSRSDKTASYIRVSHCTDYPKDSGYIFNITYFFEEDLLAITDYPLIICEPINGKKIVFTTDIYKNFFTNDYNSIGNYIEDKNSSVYNRFLELLDEREIQRKKRKETGEEWFIDYLEALRTVTQLRVRFDENGKLIHAEYLWYKD